MILGRSALVIILKVMPFLDTKTAEYTCRRLEISDSGASLSTCGKASSFTVSVGNLAILGESLRALFAY
jgi:hypothetical protein